MTLLELLVKELPKHGGWPTGVVAMAQDADGDVQNYEDMDDIRITAAHALGCSRIAGSYSLVDIEPATDRNHAIITRQQYDAALAALQQTMWNGEGLPPVGCECELFDCEKWRKVTIKYVGVKVVVVSDYSAPPPDSERVFHIATKPEKFRPIRTDAERKRDEIILSLRNSLRGSGYGLPEGAAIIVLEVIAAGLIPGLKIDV